MVFFNLLQFLNVFKKKHTQTHLSLHKGKEAEKPVEQNNSR